MATTDFSNGTVVQADWLNDVDDVVYRKAKEIVSVKDAPFNARGDGVTDDTAAIVAACNYVKTLGGTLYFPAGRYLHTGIVIDGVNGFSIKGDGIVRRGPGIAGTEGTALVYSGTGTGITLRNTGSWTYRWTIEDISFAPSGASTTVDALVRTNYIQEADFTRCAFLGRTGVTVGTGLFAESIGITNVDLCVFSKLVRGIDCTFTQSGGVNITRNNFFDMEECIVPGLMYQMNVFSNWFEGYKTAILFETGNGKDRIEAFGINIHNNNALHSMAVYDDSRFVRVSSNDNAVPIRLTGSIRNNMVANTSGEEMFHAVEIDAVSNLSVVDIRLDCSNNWFYGVSVSGISSDTDNARVSYDNNDCRDAIDGVWKPQFSGPNTWGPSERRIFSIPSLVTSTSTTAEQTLTFFDLPANPGIQASFLFRASLSATDNANTKLVRFRLADPAGPIIGQVDLGGANSTAVEVHLSCMGAHNSLLASTQATKSSGTAVAALANSTYDLSNKMRVYVTLQKSTAGDAVVLSSLTATWMPS